MSRDERERDKRSSNLSKKFTTTNYGNYPRHYLYASLPNELEFFFPVERYIPALEINRLDHL